MSFRPKNGFPWPWQVVSVKMTVLEDEYPKALPKGAAPDSAAVRGWTTFRRSCISCHSMSGAGGTVPTLGSPVEGATLWFYGSFVGAFKVEQAVTIERLTSEGVETHLQSIA